MQLKMGDFWQLMFPVRCPVCDGILFPGDMICQECKTRIKVIEGAVCSKCGKPLSDERREYCSDCVKKRHPYQQGKAVFVYEGAIKGSLYRFKYSNKREYATFYAGAAAERYKDWIKAKGIEAIAPIPMYFWKKRLRGYNQAEVFARALGAEIGIKVDTKLVKRIRNTIPQKELSGAERVQNLKNAFQFSSDIVKYKKIMLVDDIYTTGSTMDAVTEVMLAAGVEEIYYICISIGEGC